MARTIDIVVPDLGDFEDVEVIEVLVSAGDTVEPEDGLITLETDKAAMDVPSPEKGRIAELGVTTGDKVNAGDVIGRLEVEGEDAGGDHDEQDAGDDTGDDADGESPDAGGEADREDGSQDGDQETDAGSSRSSGGSRTLKVPELGDFEDVDVIEVHVSAGDEVSIDDPLVTLETDKAAMDVPAEVGGRIAEVLVDVGAKVSEGDAIVVIEADDSDAGKEAAPGAGTPADRKPAGGADAGATDKAAAPAAAKPAPQASSAKKTRLPPVSEAGFAKAHASPSVRRLARELGVDLAQVRGRGPKDRVLHEDVKAFVKAVMTGQVAAPTGVSALPQTPQVDFAKYGEIETRPLTRIQKISGPRLQASWVNLPHVTQHDLADITELEAKRQELKGAAKERGISLTPLAFIMKACVAALEEFPVVNASLGDDGESLVIKKYCHLGFAADTEQGLMVPVIRDADKKDVYELATELGELSKAAREGKLKADQLQGASFTVSSLGGIGGTAFTPIVNAPEVAILGVSRAAMQPVWNGSEFEPRLMLPLSLSYDHRVVDGALAVRFTTFLGQKLADVESLLMAIP